MSTVTNTGEASAAVRRFAALIACTLGVALIGPAGLEGQRADEEGPSCRNICTNNDSCGYMYMVCVTMCPGGWDGNPTCDAWVNPKCMSGGVPYDHRIKCN